MRLDEKEITMEEVKDENWIPCLNEKCKNRDVVIDFNFDNKVNSVCCFVKGLKNCIFVSYDNLNREDDFVLEGGDWECPYKLEWYMCELGALKERNDIVERMKKIGFKIEFIERENGIIYIDRAEKITGDENEKNLRLDEKAGSRCSMIWEKRRISDG